MGIKVGLKSGLTQSWLDNMSLKAYLQDLDTQQQNMM
jgi:hypothetical protein